MSKTRETLRQNLNVYMSDQNNMIWTEEQKNLAVNLAIQSSWPDIKTVAKTCFTLAEYSYNYALTTMSNAPWAPAQVWCATSSSATPVYREMRHSVIIERDANTYSLAFDKTWVDNRGDYIVEVRYDQYYGELSSDSATTEIPEAFLLPRAAYELCSMITLAGHHQELDAFAAKAPDFFEMAERERVKNQVLPLPVTIKLRWE